MVLVTFSDHGSVHPVITQKDHTVDDHGSPTTVDDHGSPTAVKWGELCMTEGRPTFHPAQGGLFGGA